MGEFKDGYPNGRGVCYYANGDRYEGEWANNTPNGEGIMYFATGRVYGAVWVNGSMVKELDSQETVPADPVRVDKNMGVKIWAVVVGVGKYTAMPSLKFTDDDAFRFYSHLKSPEGGALPDNQIEILVDEAATRATPATVLSTTATRHSTLTSPCCHPHHQPNSTQAVTLHPPSGSSGTPMVTTSKPILARSSRSSEALPQPTSPGERQGL